jgi:hypothetical protein
MKDSAASTYNGRAVTFLAASSREADAERKRAAFIYYEEGGSGEAKESGSLGEFGYKTMEEARQMVNEGEGPEGLEEQSIGQEEKATVGYLLRKLVERAAEERKELSTVNLAVRAQLEKLGWHRRVEKSAKRGRRFLTRRSCRTLREGSLVYTCPTNHPSA